jgi:hypothetical protein
MTTEAAVWAPSSATVVSSINYQTLLRRYAGYIYIIGAKPRLSTNGYSVIKSPPERLRIRHAEEGAKSEAEHSARFARTVLDSVDM